MSKTGLFLFNNFQDEMVECHIGSDLEWINYSDSTMLNKIIISAIVVDYDEETGIITFKSPESKRLFYVPEDQIETFWSPGFNIAECTRTSMGSGNRTKKKNRDIMHAVGKK